MSDDGADAALPPDAALQPDAPGSRSATPGPAATRRLRGLAARFPRTSAYLLRSLLLAASTVVVISLAVGATSARSLLSAQQRYREADGYRITGGSDPATWSDVVAFSPGSQWYDVLGAIGSSLPAALAIMLLLVQPAMELGVRWTRSRSLGVLVGLVPVAIIGLVICVVSAVGLDGSNSPGWLVAWSTFGTVVWFAIAWGLPVLLFTAGIMGLASLAGRRRLRPIVLGVAAVLAVGVVIGSTGLFRPPMASTTAGQSVAGPTGEFVRAISALDGVARVDVVGAGATVMMAADADAADVLAAATAVQQAAEGQSQIVFVVLQRESGGGSATDDPSASPWRLQLVPSGFPADTLPAQVERMLRAETLGLRLAITSDRPAVTVPSIAALPAAVNALGDLFPEGAFVSVPERFSMVFDPTVLSPAMVDAIVAVAVANPDAEFEVTESPKLYVNHVTPEAAAAITAILQDPALAGTSPTGYPAEYQIRTSGPDGEVFLEGTFG